MAFSSLLKGKLAEKLKPQSPESDHTEPAVSSLTPFLPPLTTVLGKPAVPTLGRRLPRWLALAADQRHVTKGTFLWPSNSIPETLSYNYICTCCQRWGPARAIHHSAVSRSTRLETTQMAVNRGPAGTEKTHGRTLRSP